MSEAQLQTKVLAYLKSAGAWTVKTMASNKNGVPDIIGCLDGKFFAIELKAPNVPAIGSFIQQHQIAKIYDSGGKAIVANNLNDVKDFLKSL